MELNNRWSIPEEKENDEFGDLEIETTEIKQKKDWNKVNSTL